MILGLALYFLIVVAALTLLCLPAARVGVQQACRTALRSSRGASTSAIVSSRRGASRAAQSVAGAALRSSAWFVQRARWILFTLVLVALPPLLALSLRHWQDLGSYDHMVSREMNEQVTALLQGEQLVPPPTLPPEMFMTPEVEQVRPMLRFASRQWELLDTEFRARLLVVFKLMEEQNGYQMVLLEGYRSPERQAQLAAQGPQVTQAAPFESYHQYGLAADVAFLRNGKIVITEKDSWALKGYELYGAAARSVGLVWGGDWRMRDYGHSELRRPGALRSRDSSDVPNPSQEQ